MLGFRVMKSLWMCLVAVPLYGQLITGSITGHVEDPGGLSVQGAAVSLTKVATGLERSAPTDERGDFVFNGIEPGEYRVSVTKQGFKTLARKDVNASSGERVALGDLRLEVGAVTESVVVNAESAHVETESAEPAAVTA